MVSSTRIIIWIGKIWTCSGYVEFGVFAFYLTKGLLYQRFFSCILAELFYRKPAFCGQTEQNMLDLIAQVCGTPCPENWEGVDKLPLYHNVKLKQYPRIVKDSL